MLCYVPRVLLRYLQAYTMSPPHNPLWKKTKEIVDCTTHALVYAGMDCEDNRLRLERILEQPPL
jgi:hypothetical protein